MKFDAVIVAAGESSRAGKNKLAFRIGRETVLERAVKPFVASDKIASVTVVTPDGNPPEFFRRQDYARINFVAGGDARWKSVLNGLKRCSSEGVLIHDGARPFLSEALLNAVIEGVEKHGSAVPALPVSDSVRLAEQDRITSAFPREKLVAVQTPQGFLRKELLAAFAATPETEFTDESERYSAYDAQGAHIIAGDERNIKITTEGDYLALNKRIGIGYDLHRMVPFGKLMLCGVEIASDMGVSAHSDGDAAIHALIDALLSAAGERDIGYHFPDTDPAYDGIDSAILLTETVEILKRKNLRPISANIVIRLQRPKLTDYIPVMRLKIASLLGIDAEDVSVAAKTGEGLDSVGKGLAVAAEAAATVI